MKRYWRQEPLARSTPSREIRVNAAAEAEEHVVVCRVFQEEDEAGVVKVSQVFLVVRSELKEYRAPLWINSPDFLTG